jgi:pilus assembly protein CpaB
VPRFRRPRFPVHALRRVAAGLLVLLAAVLALRPAPAPAHAGHPQPRAPVAVAARDLPPGTVLAAADLRVAAYSPGLVPAGASSRATGLTGRVLASGLRAGEPVTDVRLVGGGLTRLLAPGQVAAPVRPEDLAVTALVRAGDRVDVLASSPGADKADVVAERALVLATPRAGTGSAAADADSAGLLLLAVDAGTAARLAAAAADDTLTVTLPPP